VSTGVLATLRRHWILTAILLLALGLNLLGIDWGLPNTDTWNSDDISPWKPLLTPSKYLHGFHKYPYFHWWLSLACYAPYLLYLTLAGRIDLACFPTLQEQCFSDPYTQLSVLMLISRALAVLMGLGIVFGVYRLSLTLHRERAAAQWAAGIAACSWVLVSYSHLGNLDVPQCFWFVVTLVLFVQVLQRGARFDYLAFGLASGCALSTKEGIIGAYLGMGLAIYGVHVNRERGDEPLTLRSWLAASCDRKLLGMVTSGLVVYVLANNVLFNWSGFVRHWEMWLPTGSRMSGFRADFPGYALFFGKFLETLARAMGLPLLGLCGAGLLYAPRRHPWTAVLLLPAATYALFSVTVAGFAPIRFMLPLVPILAVFGGVLASRMLRVAPRLRALSISVLAVCFAHGFFYSLNGDLALMNDSRYLAESWIRENVEESASIQVFSTYTYLPRLDYLGYPSLPVPEGRIGPEILRENRPDFLIFSSKYRSHIKGEQREFVDALISGSRGYRVVWKGRGHTRLERWFQDPASWVNPVITILERDEEERLTGPPGAAASPGHSR
jgi:hypothetical protein